MPKSPKIKGSGNLADDLTKLVRDGMSDWTKTRRSEEREPSSRKFRMTRLTRQRGPSIKEAAAEIMEEAYLKVSGNGELTANARQIMYAARPHIQRVTEKPLDDAYFTQTLLPNYIAEHGLDWDVVYDARGHFVEPHEGKRFGLGTLDVRSYFKNICPPVITGAEVTNSMVETNGPDGGFGAVLFIEKEGFMPLIEKAKVAEEFDIAIMSTKGVSVTAARTLVDEMCSDYEIPLFLLHDFDFSGFLIAGTLQRDTRRYCFQNRIKVIDLGLTIEHVEAMNLETEEQYQKNSKGSMIANLQDNGASAKAIDFMFRDFDRTQAIRRVELNAMTSPQFVDLLKRGLRAHGVKKVIPEQEVLVEAFIARAKSARLTNKVEALDLDCEDIKAPKNLNGVVAKRLKAKPTARWDAIINDLVDEADVDKASPKKGKSASRRNEDGKG